MNALKSLLVCAILVAAILIVAGTQVATAARTAGTWYVAPPPAGNDSNDCVTTTTPCATINAALNKPGFVAGDTIRVAVGTYTGTGSEVVLLNKSATLSGGWDATFTTQTGMSTIDGENARRGVTIIASIQVILDRFVIEKGYQSQWTDGLGGGIFSRGILTITNSTIANNVSQNAGGIYNYEGMLYISNSIIKDNQSSEEAGGIMNYGDAVIASTLISGNKSNRIPTLYRAGGGGISSNGTLMLNNSAVIGNEAIDTGQNGGAGILANSGTVILNNSTLSGNLISADPSTQPFVLMGGGGIYAWMSSVEINNSTIGNNAAYVGGGIKISEHSQALIRNTIIAGNSASSSGRDCEGAMASRGYNLLGNTSGCSFATAIGDWSCFARNELRENGVEFKWYC